MPLGVSAQGTKIAVSPDPTWPPDAPIGGAITYTEIAETRETTPPALTRNTIEMTTHNEDDDAYVPGIRRHGELSFDMNFVPDNATQDHLTGLQKKWFDGTRNIYRITYSTGDIWLFSGFVVGIAPSAPVDDRLSAQVTIRPTGRHSWA